MKVLVVGAHTDDEHGMSGLIRLLADDGHDISLVITTDTEGKEKLRHDEMMAAANILGIDRVRYLGLPDGKLVVTAQAQFHFDVVCDSLPKPDVVFVMFPVDVHPDHRRTADLVMGRFYQRGVDIPMFFYALNSSGRAFDFVRPQTIAFYPTHYCDVGSVVSTMKEADACHKTQDAPAMWKGVEANLRGRGQEMSDLVNSGRGFFKSVFTRKKKVEYAEGYIYATRFIQPPEWIMKYLVAEQMYSRGIPFEVTKKSVGIE